MTRRRKVVLSFLSKHLWVVLIPILVGSLFLRIYRLDSVPPSPYWEEVALGYDAYSISQTGKDHHGNSYPIVAFPSYGDYKPSGYFYAIVPFIKAFGLSIWAVRLPSAFGGVLSVFLVYLISKEFFDEKTGLFAALLFAIQPWSVQFSRGGWEVNLALTCILLGTYFLLRAKRHPYELCLSVVFFAVSMYTYHAARLFAPLIGSIGGFALLVSWWKTNTRDTLQSWRLKFKRSQLIAVGSALIICFVLLFPLVSNIGNQEVSSRFSQTSIFTDIVPIQRSNEAIAKHGNSVIAKLVYHRYRYFGAIILTQWASHFSPDFLFVKGDGNLRHSTTVFGLLYPIQAVLIILGLIIALYQREKKILFLIIWVALAAIPPALVTPAPHALRFLFAAPAFTLLSAYCLSFVWNAVTPRRRMFIFFTISILFVYSVARFLSWYFVAYPVLAANDWQYGYEQLYDGLSKYKKPGESVYITREQGRPAMYYLFYSKYDPAKLQEIEPNLPKDQLELLQIGDYHFIDSVGTQPGLYATSLSKRDPNSEFVGFIRRPDWSVVWVVWRRV